MGRLFELILFAFLLWLAYQGLKARIRAFFSTGSLDSRPTPRRPAPPAAPPEVLVRCAGCGTHVPRSRALGAGANLYCSERCRAAAQS
jgi:hypothetical protein